MIKTDIQVRNLKEPKVHFSFQPFSHPGSLGLRVSPKGKKTWLISYRINGKKKKYSFGTYPFISLKEARRIASELLLGIDRGIDPNQVKKANTEAPDFKDICDEYLQHHAAHKKDGGHADRLKLHNHRLDPIREMKARDIKRRDIIFCLDQIKGTAPVSANRYKALLSKVFNFAIRRDLLPDDFTNPAMNIDNPAKERSRDTVYDDTQIKALWAAFEELRDDLPLSMKILLMTGQRLNEIILLEWPEVDLNTGTISLPGKRTKNGRKHTFPMGRWVRDTLTPDPSKKGKERVFRASLWTRDRAKIKRISGVKDFRPHDLRRTMITWLASKGVSRLVLDKMTNHVDSSIAGIYDRHNYLPEMKSAINLWQDTVCAIVSE